MKDKIEALNELYPEDVKKPLYICAKCGRVFDEHDKDYLTFEGNVYIGENDTFIGNSIPCVDGTEPDAHKIDRCEIKKTRVCLSCFMTDINDIKAKTLDDLKQKAEKYLLQIKKLNSDTPVSVPDFLQKSSQN